MVLVRIAYVADMPTPDKAIPMIEQIGGASPAAASIRSARPRPTSNAFLDPAAAPAPRRRAARQRRGRRTPANVGAVARRRRPRCAPEVAELCRTGGALRREARSSDQGHLEADLRLVRIEDRRLELVMERSAARTLVNDLSRKLEQWTGRRWTVIVSNEAGQPTLRWRKQTRPGNQTSVGAGRTSRAGRYTRAARIGPPEPGIATSVTSATGSGTATRASREALSCARAAATVNSASDCKTSVSPPGG